MLSENQIELYRANGYLLIENALSPDQLERMQSVTEGLVEKSRSVRENNELYDLEDGHSAENPRLKRIKLPHKQHQVFWDTLISDRLVSYLKPLLGENIRLHTSKLNTKAPGGGAAVEWHQDWAFYPHTNDDMLALGILLEDVEAENGPLMVIPGSHKGPVLDHHRNGVFCGAVDPQDPMFEADKIVSLPGKAGDMSIHHVRTLHGSALNLSDRARMILFYELSAADAWPINGNSGAYTGMPQLDVWRTLGENIVCGRQPAEARLTSVPVRMPVPPAPDSSSIFNVQKSGGARSAFSTEDV